MVGRSPTKRVIAFTLLELLVVLAIVAVLTATAIVRWGGVTSQASLATAVGQWARLDGQARELAEHRQCPVELTWEDSSGTLTLQAEGEAQARVIQLPAGAQIARLRTAHGGRRAAHTLRYDVQGASGSYGVELTASSGTSTWLYFAGLTGQVTHDLTEQQIDALLTLEREASPLTP